MPGDSNSSLIFFDTIQKVLKSLESDPALLEQLVRPILRALLKMTIKVPLLFDSTFEFLITEKQIADDLKLESFSILSRAY